MFFFIFIKKAIENFIFWEILLTILHMLPNESPEIDQ